MSAPRVEIDLGRIHHNARTLVDRLAARGITVIGVTKAARGSPEVARAMLDGGVASLADARIENIETMRAAGIRAPIALLRSPMPSQVDRVVRHADVSLNTEPSVLRSLSAAATRAGRTHGVVLMVELGDLREGIMPDDLHAVAGEVLALPGLVLRGIGTNLACRSGVAPDAAKMAELSLRASDVETTFGVSLEIVSGGNSANLVWALSGGDVGRVNQLRLGEAILLGREPLHRQPLDGLHTDGVTIVAEVIESKRKPSAPWGVLAQASFGEIAPTTDRGTISQAILALGHQDTDPSGLHPPDGIEIIGASSDHLIVDTGLRCLAPGDELAFQPGYGALVRGMTSPYLAHVATGRGDRRPLLPGTTHPASHDSSDLSPAAIDTEQPCTSP